MSADKIFVLILALFFVGFIWYAAWNSRQNEKKMKAAKEAGADQPGAPTPEPVTEAEPRRKKRKKGAPIA